MTRSLSPREMNVAFLVAQDFTNKEIASQLFVCEKTIKFHVTNIYKILRPEVRTRQGIKDSLSQMVEAI